MSGGNSVVTLFENVDAIKSSYAVKVGIAQMLRGGVVMEVCSPEQARIAEEAGAVAVMVIDNDDEYCANDGDYGRIDDGYIRKHGKIARMVDPDLIKNIKKATTLPVIAKARIGHFVEAQILEHVGVDFIDESESLTCADDMNFINKHNFRIPFICGCSSLGEALCRMAEGASMIRTQGYHHHDNIVGTHHCVGDGIYNDGGDVVINGHGHHHHHHNVVGSCNCDTINNGSRDRVYKGSCGGIDNGHSSKGNIVHAVRQIRSILGDARSLQSLEREELYSFARQIRAPYELLKLTKQLGRLPVMVFANGGIVTPADAAMAMQLGCDGIFLSSDVFQVPDPARKVRAFVQAASNYNDSQLLAELSTEFKVEEEVSVQERLPIVRKNEPAEEDEEPAKEKGDDQGGSPIVEDDEPAEERGHDQ